MVSIPCLCLSCLEMRRIYEDILSLSITCCLTAGNLVIKSGKLTILVQHTVISVHIQYLLFTSFCHYFVLWSVRCAREVNGIVGVSEMYGLSLWLSYTTYINPISEVKTYQTSPLLLKYMYHARKVSSHEFKC